MGTVNLKTASGGSVILSPANTASDVTITVPAISAPMAINGPCFSAYQSVSVTLSNTTFTKIPFQTKVFDTSSAFDNITNYRFQPLVAGYYQCTAGYSISIATGVTLIGIFKSNVRTSDASYVANPGGATVTVSSLLYLNGSTDYVEVFGYQSSGVASSTTQSGTIYGNYFQAAMVRSA